MEPLLEANVVDIGVRKNAERERAENEIKLKDLQDENVRIRQKIEIA